MKINIRVFFFLSILCSTTHANWSVIKLVGDKAPAGYENWSALTRSFDFRGVAIRTAVITNSVSIATPSSKETADELAEGLRASIGAPAWTKTKLGDLHFYTLNWPDKNAYFRLIIKNDHGKFLTSFANLRHPYVLVTSMEADILQKAFFEIESKKSKTTALMWPKFLLRSMAADATAAELSARDSIKVYSGYQESLKAATSGFGTKVDNFAKEVGKDGLDNMAQAIRELKEGVSDAREGEDNIAASIRSVAKFRNTVVAGLGLEVGKLIGGSIGNFVLNGMASIARDGYYWFLGKLAPEERDEIKKRVGESFDELAKQSKKIEELEKELNMQALALSYVANVPNSTLTERFSALISGETIADLKDQVQHFSKIRSELPIGSAERKACSNRIASLENVIAFQSEIRPFLSEYNSQEAMCSKFKKTLEDRLSAETELQMAKNIISTQGLSVLNQLQMKTADSFSVVGNDRKLKNDCEKSYNNKVRVMREQIEKAKCQAETSDRDCIAAADNLVKADRERAECQSAVQEALKGPSLSESNRLFSLVQMKTDIIRDQIKSIRNSDCQEKEINDHCDGTPGDLTKLRKVYNERVKLITAHGKDNKNLCPGILVGKRPLAGIENLQNDLPRDTVEIKTLPKIALPRNPIEKAWDNITGGN